ncbi:MAG: hypothetical protein FJX55_17865, partial [Alphaproteobacteria bacterium]|nr:hypothetical protein [Alphaproteobacteria bacterium]
MSAAADPLERRRLAAEARLRAERSRKANAVLYPVISGLAGLFLWELSVRLFKIPAFLLPAPS